MANVKLNVAEEKIVGMLPLDQQARARETLLAAKQENEAGRNVRRNNFALKIQSSGTLSVYGLGRQFPISLYKSEWMRLFENLDQIKAEVAKLPERKTK